ncbi:ATPase, T2SS/T4P/T4SS family [Lachnospiraceae bacterium YH-ros2228]
MMDMLEQTLPELTDLNNSENKDESKVEKEKKAFDKVWRDYINNPSNRVYLQVQKKTLDRNEFRQRILEDGKKRKISTEAATAVADDIDKALWGFDIIDDLINNDDEISDIRLVNENDICIKKRGKRYPATDKDGNPIRFPSKDAYIRFIEHITTRNNTNTAISNAAQVFTDKDSSNNSILRFSLVSDLVNTNDRPTLLIRKILKHKKTFDTLVQSHYMTEKQKQWIKDRWLNGHSFLICGPNGSGKTTLINAVLDVTPKNRSCDVIQESEELFCDDHPEMVFRRIVPKKNGTSISYSIVDIGRLALMESFDIIVIGEVKGPEAAQIAYATYTGSQCMTSVHSISAHDGYQKMIDYAMESDSKMTAKQYANQFQAMDTVIYVKDYHISEIVTAKYNPKVEGFFDFHDVYNESKGIDRIGEDGKEIEEPVEEDDVDYDMITESVKEPSKASVKEPSKEQVEPEDDKVEFLADFPKEPEEDHQPEKSIPSEPEEIVVEESTDMQTNTNTIEETVSEGIRPVSEELAEQSKADEERWNCLNDKLSELNQKLDDLLKERQEEHTVEPETPTPQEEVLQTEEESYPSTSEKEPVSMGIDFATGEEMDDPFPEEEENPLDYLMPDFDKAELSDSDPDKADNELPDLTELDNELPDPDELEHGKDDIIYQNDKETFIDDVSDDADISHGVEDVAFEMMGF